MCCDERHRHQHRCFKRSRDRQCGRTANNTTIASGGTLDVLSSGFVGSVVISGGTADLQSGATVLAPIAFVSTGAALEIGGSAAPLSAFMSGLVVSGLAVGDTVDLTDVAFVSGATASAANGFLDVTVGGTTYALGLGAPNTFPGVQFLVSGDGVTGTDVTLGSPPFIVSKGNSPYKVSSGHTDTGDIVISGGSMFVLSGGVADSTTVSSGGFLTISHGGTDSGTDARRQAKLFAVSISAAVQSGGTLAILSGGTADPATISSGGVEVVSAHGTDFGAQVDGGGVQIVSSGGSAISAMLRLAERQTVWRLTNRVVRRQGLQHRGPQRRQVRGSHAGGTAVSAVVDSVGIGTSGGMSLFGGLPPAAPPISSGGQEGVFSGGLDVRATVETGGGLFIKSHRVGVSRPRSPGSRAMANLAWKSFRSAGMPRTPSYRAAAFWSPLPAASSFRPSSTASPTQWVLQVRAGWRFPAAPPAAPSSTAAARKLSAPAASMSAPLSTVAADCSFYSGGTDIHTTLSGLEVVFRRRRGECDRNSERR